MGNCGCLARQGNQLENFRESATTLIGDYLEIEKKRDYEDISQDGDGSAEEDDGIIAVDQEKQKNKQHELLTIDERLPQIFRG